MNFKKLYLLIPLFIFTTAYAALTVTHLGNRIGPKPTGLGCNDFHEALIDSDGGEELMDVTLTDDGTTILMANTGIDGQKNITEYKLSTPFDVSTMVNDCTQSRYNITLFDGVSADNRIHNIFFEQDGTRFFATTRNSEVLSFSLSTPFDIGSATFNAELDLAGIQRAVAFNNEGTKLYELDNATNAPKVNTYSMTTPYDIANATLTDTLDLSETELVTISSTNKQADDIHFNDTGSAMYILMHNSGNTRQSYIWQFSLDKRFDVSTAKIKGKWNVALPGAGGYGFGMPRGFDFSSDGMKLYVTNRQSGAGVDQVYAFQLECPFGLYECVYESESSIGSQIELAKQNIQINTSTVFKRFEWIKRNKDKNDLNNISMNFNTQNKALIYLKNELQNSFNERIQTASLNSDAKKNKMNNEKWSFWAHSDISTANKRETLSLKDMDFKSVGFTLGADQKIGKKSFGGLAFRYGIDKADIKKTVEDVSLDSFTLNYYITVPRENQSYFNIVSGLSQLNYKHKHKNKVTGKRKGYQAFTALSLRTEESYGKLNLIPSSKINLGITRLSEYTDKVSQADEGEDITYKKNDFATADIAAGFLFNTSDIQTSEAVIRPNGGIEYILDVSPKVNYSQVGSSSGQRELTYSENEYSNQYLKANIGFESIYESGNTIGLNYERYQNLGNHNYKDSLFIKLGYINSSNTQFAFNYDPLDDNNADLSFVKNVDGFDLKLNSNYNFNTNSDYSTYVEISNKF